MQKLFGYANRMLSGDFGGEDAGCGGPGLV